MTSTLPLRAFRYLIKFHVRRHHADDQTPDHRACRGDAHLEEEAEREISNGIASADQQLAQLEQEGQQVVDEVRRQSANPLDPRVQDQVAQIQQQVAAKRAEIEEQKRNLLQQQAQVRELEMDQIVEQGQLESSCEVKVGDNLVQAMQVAIVVRDGVIQSIEHG